MIYLKIKYLSLSHSQSEVKPFMHRLCIILELRLFVHTKNSTFICNMLKESLIICSVTFWYGSNAHNYDASFLFHLSLFISSELYEIVQVMCYDFAKYCIMSNFLQELSSNPIVSNYLNENQLRQISNCKCQHFSKVQPTTPSY